jgi:hypothetical protein
MLAELRHGFPYSPFLHVGENETGGIPGAENCPGSRDAIDAFASQTGSAADGTGYLLSYFHNRVSELAKLFGFRTMVWGSFGFTTTRGDFEIVRESVRQLLSRDIIIWDWRDVGFANFGWTVWSAGTASWEWRGPGVPAFVSHQAAFQIERLRTPGLRPADWMPGWVARTFGIPDPAAAEAILSVFGTNLPGDAGSEPRWHRLIYGNYLLRRPSEYADATLRHPSLTQLTEQVQFVLTAHQTLLNLEALAQRNSWLARWYRIGIELNAYALVYLARLQSAYWAASQGDRDTAIVEINEILVTMDGPIAEIYRRALTELGGPNLELVHREAFADFRGVTNGVQTELRALIQKLGSAPPGTTPESMGLHPGFKE